MLEKLINLEKKIFSTPYKWLLKKGIIQVINTSKKIERTMEDLYESLYDEPYAGNPNWAGDD
jgi:hypothetical protein|tara:strand:+ start:720 stop:905 length:186 start_codon:yes stop_codon:yes gene_type:complete